MAAGTTDIQWTWKFNPDGTVASKGRTWNTGSGCRHRGPECLNCYAEKLHDMRHKAYMEGKTGLPKQYAKPFSEYQAHQHRLEDPLAWKKGCRIFVNSMTDTFHEDASDTFIAETWATMALADWHTFLVLTKRAQRMQALISSLEFRRTVADRILKRKFKTEADQRKSITLALRIEDGAAWPLPNVWLGVSCGTQATADRWVPLLLETPAYIRFLSMEPLLERVVLWEMEDGKMRGPAVRRITGRTVDTADFPSEGYDESEIGIDWIICGGESGAGGASRIMPEAAALALRDDCVAAGIPFFFKQHGDWAPGQYVPDEKKYPTKIETSLGKFSYCSDDWMTEQDHGPIYYQLGKKKAGRNLDGREWNEYPAEA